MLLLSNLICIHIPHPGGTPIRGKSADLTSPEWSCSFSLSFHLSHIRPVFRPIPITSINLISFPPFAYDSWLSHCGLSFSFSLFVLFIPLFMKTIISVVICFKESISRSSDHRPVTAYHLSLFLFFFPFLLPFSFFSYFFSFFSSSFTFFLSNWRKKKIIFFFLSCSCSGPKPGRSGEQWQTCRRQPGPSAFCLYLSKGFCFCSSILFSLTVLKVKEWLPLPPDPPSVWQQRFFLHFFFSWMLVSGFLDLLSFSRGNRFSVLLVVCGIAGFSYFDSVCVSFVILLLYFSWGFVTPHC